MGWELNRTATAGTVTEGTLCRAGMYSAFILANHANVVKSEPFDAALSLKVDRLTVDLERTHGLAKAWTRVKLWRAEKSIPWGQS